MERKACTLTALFAGAVAAQDLSKVPATIWKPDFSNVEIKTTKVAGNIWMLEGVGGISGGNIAASVGEDGVAIVDDKFAELSPRIHAELAKLSPKPVRFLINTHWHFDHAGGNARFADSAAILAHANVRKRLLEGQKLPTREFPPAEPAALPILTFEDGVSLFWNGEEVRAIHLRPGHTDGDVAVWFTKSNVVHLGDDFVTYGFPFIDLQSGGSVRGMIAALDSILVQIPKNARIIPGHGPISTVEDVRKFRAALEEMVAIVEKARKTGRTLEQMKQDNLLAPWAPANKGFVTPELFIAVIDQDLAR